MFITLTVPAQIVQIGQDLEGEAVNDESASAVSMSDDGRIIAVGAPSNQGNGFKSGHIRVFQDNQGTWQQLGGDIDGETMFDYLGYSVSVNGDGTVVAGGAPYKLINGLQTGHVPIFKFENGEWLPIGEPIVGEDVGDFWGGSVALNHEGNIVAIGGNLNDGSATDAGHVRIFQNIEEQWQQLGTALEGTAASDNFGWAVAINAQGNIVAAGAISNDDNGADAGHVRVFENIGGSWQQLGNTILGEAAGDSSGWAVSLNAEGDILAVGAPFNQDNGQSVGHVRVFQNISGVWTQMGNDIDGESQADISGESVILNAMGDVVAIGASGNDGNGPSAGHVRVFQFDGVDWQLAGEDIEGAAENDFSGSSVALSAVGKKVVIGSPFNDGNGDESGHARVFELIDLLNLADNEFQSFLLWPSPTKGVVHIEYGVRASSIEVYSFLGQKVLSTAFSEIIDISTLETGMYMIRITSETGNSAFQKIFKY